MLDVSIVIVNWNTVDFLRSCLLSLYKHTRGVSFDVWVVDNNSGDGSAEMVKSEFPEVKLIANEFNLGHSKANNQGIKASNGRYVFLINPDIIFLDNAVGELVEFMDRHTRAGAVAPKLLNPDGSRQHSCRSFPTPDCIIFEALYLSYLFPKSKIFGKYRMTHWDYGDVREVEQPMGSALMVRREAIDEVGLLDEQFFVFFGDVDWCYRLKEKGWQIYFTPGVCLVHFYGQSTRQVRLRMIMESHKGLYKFYSKHYRGRLNFLVYWGLVLLIFCGSLVRWLGVVVKEKRFGKASL